MPTTFNVIFLGNLADIDTIEGNTAAENASALVGQTYGGFGGNALAGNIQTLSPGNPRRDFDSDGNTYYDQDDPSPERFRIDGGPQQNFDATVVYDATITYLDGSTADITAVVFQDTNGNTYLAPEFSFNADQVALEAAPLLSITLNGFSTNAWLGMTGNRSAGNFAPCFTPGALIDTETGPCPVETLAIGDRVVTADNGLQAIRWIGSRTVPAEGAMTPVRIRAGALGQGLPHRDVVVSPQHRMLLRSRIADRMIGQSEVLMAAKKLIGLPGVSYADDLAKVTYIHFLCDRHEIVFVDGAPTETLLTGQEALKALEPESRSEIAALFPEVLISRPTPARPIPPGRVARSLLARHAKNAKPLLAA